MERDGDSEKTKNVSMRVNSLSLPTTILEVNNYRQH